MAENSVTRVFALRMNPTERGRDQNGSMSCLTYTQCTGTVKVSAVFYSYLPGSCIYSLYTRDGVPKIINETNGIEFSFNPRQNAGTSGMADPVPLCLGE